jgi:hypothetical protein
MEGQLSKEDLSCAEYYRLIRGQIEHQDELVNQRILWQIIAQAFFFSAYASVLNAPQDAKTPLFEAGQLLLFWLMPIAGLLAGALTYVSISASMKTIDHLRLLYEDYIRAKTPQDSSSKLFPFVQGPPDLLKLAKVSPTWMPILFTVTWFIVLASLLIAAWQGG